MTIQKSFICFCLFLCRIGKNEKNYWSTVIKKSIDFIFLIKKKISAMEEIITKGVKMNFLFGNKSLLLGMFKFLFLYK